MRKADYAALASILNQDIRHSEEYRDFHLTRALKSIDTSKVEQENQANQIRKYELRKVHTIDLTRAIARNISVNETEFLKACGID